jgi:predicted alpha/beta superfamily hydrolase
MHLARSPADSRPTWRITDDGQGAQHSARRSHDPITRSLESLQRGVAGFLFVWFGGLAEPFRKKATITASKSTAAVISTYKQQTLAEKVVYMQSRHVGNAIVLITALFVSVVISMLVTSAFAQTKSKLTVLSESDPSADGARQFVVHSTLVGRDYVVVVSPPPIFGSWVSADLKAAGSKQLEQKLPAIYALDAGYGIAGPMAQMMAGVATMSPAYVVSVGYREGQTNFQRTDLLHHSVTEGAVTYGGGGAKFQSFLTEELRPFVEARYPLDPTRAILYGHSFGGLFAANVLADSPDSFDGYVIGSPSVWIDPQVLAKVAGAAKGNGHRIFVAVGEKEDLKMLDGASQLAATLTAAPSSFKVEKRVFAGESHISYYPLLTQAAFAWLMPPPGNDRTAINLPPEALQRITGAYQLADGRVVTVTLKAAKAFVEVTGMTGESELLAETAQRFFLPGGYSVLFTFEGAMDAPATSLIVNMNGTELRASRKVQ